MVTVMKRVTIVALLAAVAAVGTHGAEPPGDGEWLTLYRVPANTVSTPVRFSDEPNVLWASPAGGAVPLVYIDKNDRQLLVSGNFVYDAWTGELVHAFPEGGDRAAITTVTLEDATTADVLLIGRARDGFHNSQYEFFAYDLDTYDPLWYLDSLAGGALTLDTYVEINAKDGVFYITGLDTTTAPYCGMWGVAAVNAYDGTVQWQKPDYLDGLPVSGWLAHPAVASVSQPSGVEDVVYLGFGWDPGSDVPNGLLALKAKDGSLLWSCGGYSVYSPSVDEASGILYVGVDDGYLLRAFDAAVGTVLWTGQLDNILNGPPTLGWVNETPAVFAVTGGGDRQTAVFAFDRSSGRLLWQSAPSDIPEDAYASATYSGGKLYIGAFDELTYVLDADDGGKLLQILGTDGSGLCGESNRVIVEGPTVEGAPQSVMYYLTYDGSLVEAWSLGGSGSPPQVFQLSVRPQAAEIPINSSTSILAELVDGNLQPIAGVKLTFSCDAGNNQGYLDPTVAYTGEAGRAETVFFSQNRTAVVTITAETTGARAATTTVTVVKGGGGAPPVQTGTIQGRLLGPDGNPVKKGTVIATKDDGASWQATSSPKDGTYKLADLPAGTYTVEGFKDGVGYAVVTPVILQPGGTEVVDLYLKP